MQQPSAQALFNLVQRVARGNLLSPIAKHRSQGWRASEALYSRPGNELTGRFPLIVEALARLRVRSCIIDGEAVACYGTVIAQFNRIRYRRYDATCFSTPST
jgi:hypothetical protein